MFGDIGPCCKGGWEPTCRHDAAEYNAPVHDCYEEGVADYCAVEEGMQGLEGAGEAGEEGCSGVRVGEGVEGGEGEVEGYAPVAEDWGEGGD